MNREQYSALHLASMYSREDTIKVTSVVVVNLLAVMGVFVADVLTVDVIAIAVAAVIDLDVITHVIFFRFWCLYY